MSEIFEYFKNEPKLQVLKYSYPFAQNFHFGVVDQNSGVRGFGGDKDSGLAQTKALFELIERTLFRSKKTNSNKTSSGWCAHKTLEEAIQGAHLELLERDAVLCSWILKLPPQKVGTVDLIGFDETYTVLKFGESKDILILGIVVGVKKMKSRMLLSTAARDLKTGVEKLKVDAERAFVLLNDPNPIEDGELLAHHQSFCEMTEAEIQWLYENGDGITYKTEIEFKDETYEVPLWNGTKAFVCKSSSDDLQELYFGQLTEDKINRKRILQLSDKKLNERMHPIL